MNPKSFVAMLADVRMPLVFNPYVDTCPIYDRKDAPERRRANLEQFLRAAMEAPELSIWIGRDLGYRGGRRTGIALTDEAHLPKLSSLYPHLALSKATNGPVVAERTATVFWDMIGQLSSSVFTWNIFPFHPFERGKPLSNRAHSRAERIAVSPVLEDLFDMLKPAQVIAIGNDAEAGLHDLAIPCTKVRHPSYGGISDFRRGVELTHSLKRSKRYSQPTLL